MIEKIIISLYFFEIFCGGGGRVFVIGGIPMRMALFSLIIFITSFKIVVVEKKFPKTKYIVLYSVLLLWILIVALFGLLNNHNISYILGDIKPISYLLIFIPMIYIFENRRFKFSDVYNILILSSSIMIVITIFMMILIYTGALGSVYDVRQIVNSIFKTFEIGIRSNGSVFYNGYFYLLISCILIYAKQIRSKTSIIEKIILLLGIVVIIQSTTKGLILSLIIGFIIVTLLGYKQAFKGIVRFMIIISIVIFMYIIIVPNTEVLSRISISEIKVDGGVNKRIEFTNEVLTKMDSLNIIWGKGLGEVLDTEGGGHLENSYLEILLEQGLIGVVIWISLILFIIFDLINKYSKKMDFMSLGLISSLISILALSATNPYINNPLGISLLTISMCYGINRYEYNGIYKGEK